MLKPGDIKIVPPIQTTYGKVGTSSVPCYKIFFTVRDQGPYSVLVQTEGYSVDRARQAIEEVAGPIVDTLDAFK